MSPSAPPARRVLFLAANPDETTRLNLEEEMREVRVALERGTTRGFVLFTSPAQRILDLQHVLDQERPDIVHFGGHGSDSRQEIIFLDDHDNAFPVDVEALADLLGCFEGVVLNACSSLKQAEAIAERGAWAIGMVDRINTDAAVAFARELYFKLADGKEPEESCKGATLQLRLLRMKEAALLPRFVPGKARATQPSKVTQPESPLPESVEHEPRPTELAFAVVGLDGPPTDVVVSACIVTDMPDRLANEIESWKEKLIRDPVVPERVKLRARKADLVALVAEPALRPRLLAWLSVTSFSAYVYYAKSEAIAGIAAAEKERRFLVEPLVHRMRKKSERIKHAEGERVDLAQSFAKAAEVVRGEVGHVVPTPEVGGRERRVLVELAKLVAQAVSRHLASPSDDDATTVFENLRTRVRFAMNVANHEVHTRDRNPLS